MAKSKETTVTDAGDVLKLRLIAEDGEVLYGFRQRVFLIGLASKRQQALSGTAAGLSGDDGPRTLTHRIELAESSLHILLRHETRAETQSHPFAQLRGRFLVERLTEQGDRGIVLLALGMQLCQLQAGFV